MTGNQITFQDLYQPYYLEWCRQTGQTPGNRFKTYEFIAWISERHREFRLLTGWPDGTAGLQPYKNEFIRWLRSKP